MKTEHKDLLAKIEAQSERVNNERTKLRALIDTMPPEMENVPCPPAVVCASGCGCMMLDFDVEDETPIGSKH